MDKLQKQIDIIRKQKVDLDIKLQQLIDQRSVVLQEIIKSVSSPDLDIYILVGGMLDVVQKSKSSSELTEEWRLTGQKFCRKHTASYQKNIDHSQENYPHD